MQYSSCRRVSQLFLSVKAAPHMLDSVMNSVHLASLINVGNWTWSWVWLGWTLHIVSFLLVCAHCLKHRREATSAILWIFVTWSFPVIGLLCYVAIGINRVEDKGLKKHAADQKLLAESRAIAEDALPLAYWNTIHEARGVVPPTPFGRYLNASMRSLLPDNPLLGGNDVKVLVDGDDAYPEMLTAIENARHHIHLQTFIIRNDAIGRQMLDRLAEKARSGVKVRFLYDKFGSTYATFSGLFLRYRRTDNFFMAGWTQANIFKRQFQINLRNHRKIMVVDGQVAFTGGMNIDADNMTRDGNPPIRDYHFMINGPMVQELQYSFVRDWCFTTDESPGELLQESYFPHLETAGPVMARLVNTGPTTEMQCITDVFFMAITAARKQILAVTPYFVPPRDILRALRTAALRGVDVRLTVPLRNNHVYAGLAGRALFDELLCAGVRVFQRTPPFAHAKALIVDDEFALVGTANLDARSLQLNYETNMAVYDDNFVNRLKGIVLSDLAQSREVKLDEWRQRPVRKQILENLAHLMMPVL